MTDTDLSLETGSIAREIAEHGRFFRIGGAVAIVTGVLAILLPHVATLATGLAIGALFLVNGVVGVVTAFRARGGRLFAGFLAGLLAIVAGAVLFLQPFAGIVALTLFLAAFLLAAGLLRLWFAWNLRPAQGWRLVGGAGLLSALLGVLIASGLPGNAFWVIGLLVGVDLVSSGVALLALVRAVERGGDGAARADRDQGVHASAH